MMMMNLTNDSSVCGSGGGSNYLRNVTTPTSSTSLLGSCGSSIGSSNSSFGGFPMISRLTGGTLSPTSTSNSILTTTSPQTLQLHQPQQLTSPGSDVLNHHTSPRGRSTSTTATPDDVVKCGYLRKMKGSRKFFVLRREVDDDHPARLEYYVNDKLFRTGKPPRKSVALKTCFNISGTEKKGKFTINLHTKNDCVQISMSNEQEMNEWLKVMNALAGQEEEELLVEGKSHFEHVWMVQALNKGLGSKENIIGPYRLQLTSKELALYKFGEHDGRNDIVRFPLNVIRNVSHDSSLGCFFHIELGRLAPTGPGQLSLKTDDNNITQNMHLLILTAMQNYSKEDVIPRERVRLDTWNSDSNSSIRSMHSTPPGMSRINSMDGSIRIRTDSVSSAVGGASQPNQASSMGMSMSPPVPIVGPTPSISFNSPMCSTGTESASSSYSVDYDNNNHGMGDDHLQHEMYPKRNGEDESYVAWNPADDQQHSSFNSLGSLTLPLNPDMSDYVDTSIVSRDSTSSTAQTPSSYMEMQSPMSPFDNYLPMSPAGVANSGSSIKYNNGGKSSANHSRNSSLLEEMDGYVPMIPGGQYSRAESGAGSITGSANGLDENYLDMDLSRKLNISNDDICRASPASNESLPSNTPSSDFPLEKVMSYLTDDMEDSVRPLRAYSVGSRSDTSANKSRLGRNRLEAVQENFRTRAMSVGSKNPRKPGMNMGGPSVPNGSRTMTPLSNSWSGSTGRWLPKFATSNSHNLANQQSYSPSGYTYNHSHTASESADSDLMELDFSKNKTRNRKRSLTNQVNNFIAPPTPPIGSTSQSNKLSPVPKGALGTSLNEISPGSDASESSKISSSSSPVVEGPPNRNYTPSAPISIQRNNTNVNDGFIYPDPNSSQSLSTMLKGNNDLKQLNETEDETAYLDMDFTPNANQKPKSEQVNTSGTVATKFLPGLSNFKPETPIKAPVVVTPKLAPYPGTKFSLYAPSSSSSLSSLTSPVKTAFSLTHEPASQLNRSLSSSSNISTTSNNSNSSSASCVSVKSQSVLSDSSSSTSVGKFLGSDTSATSLSALPGLCRIEESPEKQHDGSKASSSGSVTPQSPSRHTPIGIPSSALNRIPDSDDQQVTYASIEHVPSACRQGYTSGSCGTTNSCGSTSVTPNKCGTVAYAQIDFVKTSEALKPNN